MANTLYPLYKENVLAGTAGYDLDVNTAVDGPYACLVDTGVYTYNAGHQFFSQLSGIAPATGTVIGLQIVLPTVVGGVFDGNDVAFLSVPAGPSYEAIVVYRHNAGANTTWPLVMYYDLPGGGLPVTANGGNITLTWNVGGIFIL